MATTDHESGTRNPSSTAARGFTRRKRRRATLVVGTLAAVTAGAILFGFYGMLQEASDRAH